MVNFFCAAYSGFVRRKADAIAVVETAYGLTEKEDDGRYLDRILEVACPTLSRDGLGAAALTYDLRDERLIGPLHVFGGNQALFDALVATFTHGRPAERAKSFDLLKPVGSLSAICGGPPAELPSYEEFARATGFRDIVAVRCANPDGTGVFIGAAAARLGVDRRTTQTWSRIAAHLAAGLRLRRVVARASAVMTARGKVLHAEADAVNARAVLSAACIAIDRARGPARRTDPDGALEAWTALVDGKWSLVDRFESDGKRFVVALPNAPASPDPRALAPSDRPILQYVAKGWSNKLVAYTLGIPEGTVATAVARISRRLGARSRADLIELAQTLLEAEFVAAPLERELVLVGVVERAPRAWSALTAAERDVAERAMDGMSNTHIARIRGCAERTVANLLASAYRKLGVSSRWELAAGDQRGRSGAPSGRATFSRVRRS